MNKKILSFTVFSAFALSNMVVASNQDLAAEPISPAGKHGFGHGGCAGFERAVTYVTVSKIDDKESQVNVSSNLTMREFLEQFISGQMQQPAASRLEIGGITLGAADYAKTLAELAGADARQLSINVIEDKTRSPQLSTQGTPVPEESERISPMKPLPATVGSANAEGEE